MIFDPLPGGDKNALWAMIAVWLNITTYVSMFILLAFLAMHPVACGVIILLAFPVFIYRTLQ